MSAACRRFGAVPTRHIEGLGVQVFEAPADAVDRMRTSLESTGLFEYVEPDYYAEVGSTPNDPSYLSQWYLDRIRGPEAWTVTTGSDQVVVAVLDSGVYAAHPDLAARLVPGWNFVKSNGDTSDILGHGTEVAGTLGASTNNGIGIAGVSWSGMVMPLVVVDKNNFAAYSDIAAAIQYAADRRVRVINVSVGGSASSSTLQSAVDYAWSRGSMVFAAAMNNAVSTPSYPAACAHAIAVSATDQMDRLASFSSFGNWITLSAPGTDILTTVAGGGYGYMNGTSFAAPIAAGVAALVISANPQLSNAQVLEILKQSADPGADGGFDPRFGWGRVNAWKAVQLAAPPRSPAPPRHAPAPPDEAGPHRAKR